MDPLDDFLVSQPARTWRKSARLLKALREAYTYGVPVLQMKGHIDQMTENSGYRFVCGTPDETLRRIVAFLLTNCEAVTLADTLPQLWARGGREDILAAGILLANFDSDALASGSASSDSAPDSAATCADVWKVLAGLLRQAEPLEGLLFVVEELFRAGHGPVRESVLLEWFAGESIHVCLALLCTHAGWVRGGRGEVDGNIRGAVESADVGDSDGVLVRVRDQLLQAQ